MVRRIRRRRHERTSAGANDRAQVHDKGDGATEVASVKVEAATVFDVALEAISHARQARRSGQAVQRSLALYESALQLSHSVARGQ